MKQTISMALLATSLFAGQSCTTQTQFSTPDRAAHGLYEAIKAHDDVKLTNIMGKDSLKWLFSGDKVIDEKNRKIFLEQYSHMHMLKETAPSRYSLTVGIDERPFPAAIVACNHKWGFDGTSAREEIINRRIGENELDTIQTLLAVVDAQREYATSDADGNGVNDYAQRFLSQQGKKDGLYWKSSDEKQSPLGIMVATAAKEGYTKAHTPYHGYFYTILTSQGKAAADGKYSYMVADKMIGGFAILAYPAKYGSSGVMSFIVNHDGVVYQKNLGSKTSKTAHSITVFNPDKSWKKID